MNKKIGILLIMIIGIVGCASKKEEKKINIITSNFPGYDFTRAITKEAEDVNVKMLLKPGSEMHDFEPTPKDIIDIQKSDMFIYIGGESDEWIKDVLDNIDTDKTKVIKLMDLVKVVPEEHVEGMEEHHNDENEEEYDEHIWTSPINAITITNKLKDEIIKIDRNNKELYEKNTNKYVSKLTDIDNKIKDIVKNAKRNEIIFGDRFPLKYFTDEYNLKYYASFPGCSEQTEASAKTISFLINKVKEDNIPVVFHLELSNKKLANEIAKQTNAKVLEFSSAHNISKEDFDKGITYVDLMNKNIKALKEALN